MSDPLATWTPEQIPDQSSRRTVVTGVTSGIGESVALELARHGADVVLAARSQAKLDATVADLRRVVPEARLQPVLVDLADLTSVRRAAREIAQGGPVHALVNNAGVMALPHERTVDGFEKQFATNHLGPFALTGLLLPSLVGSGAGVVVNTSSMVHWFATHAPLADPRTPPRRYSRWDAYAGSKLADLMFTVELDRRLRAGDLPVRSVAAHPGYSATGLMHRDPHSSVVVRSWERLLGAFFPLFGQRAGLGALPTLCAATADLPGGSYVGPAGPGQLRGRPQLVGMRRLARDPEAGRRLWEISEQATGVAYP